MNVAVFGGSFNPIHRGHTSLIRQVLRTDVVDEVWLMPSPLNPLKQAAQSDLLPYDLRLRLARMATAQMPRVHVSDAESRLPLPSYTFRTLQSLRRDFPSHCFFLLIGEDNWQRFNHWRNAEEIRRTTPILVYGRETGGLALHRPNDTERMLDNQTPLFPVSGTAIRGAIRAGQRDFCRQWLNGHVWRYIERHALYR